MENKKEKKEILAAVPLPRKSVRPTWDEYFFQIASR